jgi:hypothetical protein
MRDYEQVLADARPGKAFSNGTQYEIWSYNWCHRCAHDDPDGPFCPLMQVAFTTDKTPAEWMADTPDAEIFADYTCVEFRDRDQGPSPEPQPIPDPPGQLLLLPREPYEATRMFVQPSPVTVP